VLECSERGAGVPLVFVHGSASDMRAWHAQQEAFGPAYRAIVYSRRYHWPNARIPTGADYSMAEHVDDLQALLNAIGAAPAHLVGHSYGAYLCLLLAIRQPEVVRSLVLVEPPVLPLFVDIPPKPSQLGRLFVGRPRTAAAIIKFAATGFAPAAAAVRRGDAGRGMRIFGRAVLGREAYGRLTAQRLEQVRVNTIEAEFLGSGFAPLPIEAVRSIRCPVLLVTGQRSPALFHRLTDRLAELMPHARRVEIAGASHMVHEDDAAAFNTALRSHLNHGARSVNLTARSTGGTGSHPAAV